MVDWVGGGESSIVGGGGVGGVRRVEAGGRRQVDRVVLDPVVGAAAAVVLQGGSAWAGQVGTDDVLCRLDQLGLGARLRVVPGRQALGLAGVEDAVQAGHPCPGGPARVGGAPGVLLGAGLPQRDVCAPA